MMQRTGRLRLWRFAIDASMGLAAFVFVSLIALGGDSHAGPAGFLATPLNAAVDTASGSVSSRAGLGEPVALTILAKSQADGPVFRKTSKVMALGVLAAMFSVLAAFNLAFLRHLRRVYAPRKRVRAVRSA